MNSHDLCELYAIRPSALVDEHFPTPPQASFLGLPSNQTGQSFAVSKLYYNYYPSMYTRTSFPCLDGTPSKTQPLTFDAVTPIPKLIIPMAQRTARVPECSCNVLPWQRPGRGVRAA